MATLIGKPVVQSTTAFDLVNASSDPYIIKFTWNGQRCYGNRLTINGKNHDLTGLSTTQHAVNSDCVKTLGLRNGNKYNAQVTMLDKNGDPCSNPSDTFVLYCYPTPTLEIQDLTDNMVLEQTKFQAIAKYTTKYSVNMLSSYKFNLYTKLGVWMSGSPQLYLLPTESTTDFSDCSYTFSGLNNGTDYIFEVIGITVYGSEISTKYKVKVSDGFCPVDGEVELDTSGQDGNINVKVTTIGIEYDYNNTNSPAYSDGDWINLQNENYVTYKLKKPLTNFSIKTTIKNIDALGKELLSFYDSDSDDKLVLTMECVKKYTNTVYPANVTLDESMFLEYSEYEYNGTKYFRYLDVKSSYFQFVLKDTDGKFYITAFTDLVSNTNYTYNSDLKTFEAPEGTYDVLIIKNNGMYKLLVNRRNEGGDIVS